MQPMLRGATRCAEIAVGLGQSANRCNPMLQESRKTVPRNHRGDAGWVRTRGRGSLAVASDNPSRFEFVKSVG